MKGNESRLTTRGEGHPGRPDGRQVVAEGLLTVPEAASFLSVSRSKLYEMMDRGLLPYVKLGRARRIPRRALVELAAGELRGGYWT